jgi:geranylgeranyl pyrophosphate synthase
MSEQLAILDLVYDDLKRVEQKMRAMGGEAYGPLAEAFLHLLGSGGKRLRPALALVPYRFFYESASEKTIALAAAVETLHNATLVHDDLIDGALLRRGSTTLNAIWGRGATVLAGDYLFARSAGFAAESENVRVVQLFAETLRIICDGELRQLFSTGQWRQPVDTYYKRIFAKTASLFAAATRSAAILADAPAEMEQALYDYGYHLGMAFQIVDDILDFTGDEAVLGKPVGSDLRQGIITLPFFYYLQEHPSPDALLAELEQYKQNDNHGNASGALNPASAPRANGRQDPMAEVIASVRTSEAIQHAAAEARAFAVQAKTDLLILPDGECRQAMDELADFVVARQI